MRPRVLLANEAGGGRGHVTLLRQVGQALGPDVTLIAGLGRQAFAAELSGICEKVVTAPRLSRAPDSSADPRYPGNASWGDALAALGLAREAVVRRGLAFWRELIVAEDIDLLVADAAPLAMLAAQGLRAEGWQMRVASVGTGWGLPPDNMPDFPLIMKGMGGVLYPEMETLALVNRVAAERDIQPLPTLPSLYQADLALALTSDFLDPYAAWRRAGERIAPLVAVPEAGQGHELFVYFSAREIERPGLIEALEALPLARRGFIPRATEAEVARLRASGMVLEDAPLPPALIVERSAMILHAGAHGSMSMAALAGLPQLALPSHLEQLWNAQQAEAAGCLRIVPDDGIGAAMLAAYSDAGLKAGAQALARSLRAAHPADPQAALAERLAPLLRA